MLGLFPSLREQPEQIADRDQDAEERLDARPYYRCAPDADDPRGHEVELALAPGQEANLERGGEPISSLSS